MFIEIDDLRINYIVEGEGDTIVLLHGWGTNIDLMRSFTNSLYSKYRVIALDFPGFGLSDEPKEPWSVYDYTDFFVKFMEALKIQSCHLLGHSFGGRVMICLSDRKDLPFTINKMIFVDAAGIKPKKKFSTTVKVKAFKLAKKVFQISFLNAMYPNFIENWRKKVGSSDYNAATPVMRQSLVKIVNEDLKDYLPKIKNKSLLIWGDQDTATPLSDGKTFKELIPDSYLFIVSGAGHYSYLEQPILVNKTILRFLEQ